ncbi:lysosomal thioesterase PPT2-B-like [Clytia hemisphaerica]|uniref:lysosomal thioesterase PPT2-B-like n=1 Tax=Clytia hemisphaerica TaxID=252671 RepID=UPI0034D784B3
MSIKMMLQRKLIGLQLYSVMLVIFLPWVEAYKTVVLVHGLNCGADSFEDTKQKILDVHPGTNVILLKYFENLRTLDPLPGQLDLVVSELDKIMKKHPDGIHLLCHSQGGLMCLGAVLNLNHTIETFISLSGPLFGQYGDPLSICLKLSKTYFKSNEIFLFEYHAIYGMKKRNDSPFIVPAGVFDEVPIMKPLLNLSRELVSIPIYSDLFQGAVSIANYWKDPRDSMIEAYEYYSNYVPVILNDPRSRYYNQKDAAIRKENFLRLKNLVLVGGPGDEIITPWQSALFGFYGNDPFSETMLNMTETKMYQDDWFGLKTQNDQGRVTSYVIPGIDHDSWPGSDFVLKLAVYPWLT